MHVHRPHASASATVAAGARPGDRELVLRRAPAAEHASGRAARAELRRFVAVVVLLGASGALGAAPDDATLPLLLAGASLLALLWPVAPTPGAERASDATGGASGIDGR